MSTTSLADLPIRRLTPRDLTACADLSESRGWPRDEHKWRLLLSAGTGYGIDAPDGGLLAACTVTEYGLPGRTAELAAIGMVLVAERYGRQGVGRRLMRQVIDQAGTTPLTLHATPNGQPLYEELGFKVTGRAEMLRGRFDTTAAKDPEAGHVSRETELPDISVRPASAGDISSILRLDAGVFGSDRTHVITRLPAFTDHLRVAETRDGDLVGFAGAWPADDTHVVGPLVAHDTATAKALVVSLAEASDRPLRTDIDVRHEELRSWLMDHGLKPVAFNSVMTYGAADLPGDPTRRFAPLTVAAG